MRPEVVTTNNLKPSLNRMLTSEGVVSFQNETEPSKTTNCFKFKTMSISDSGHDKPQKMDFLVSFLVDARGGSMTGSRRSGVRYKTLLLF